MSTLLDNLMQQFNADTINQVSQRLGVDEQTARKGIEVGLPLLISALTRESSSPEGAQSLTRALARDHDGSILNNVPEAVRNYETHSGDGILGHILGNKRQNIEDSLSKSTGMDAGALLQMLAPVVMGALAQQQQQQNLDAGGVSATLQREQAQLQQSGGWMPLVTNLLDADKDGSIVDDVTGMLGNLFNQRQK